MRLSEDRVSAVAAKIAFALVKKRYVKTAQNLRQVTTWVERPILDNLAAEDKLDADVRAQLGGMSTCPPEGSFAWQALFQKKKEELAARRQYEL